MLAKFPARAGNTIRTYVELAGITSNTYEKTPFPFWNQFCYSVPPETICPMVGVVSPVRFVCADALHVRLNNL